MRYTICEAAKKMSLTTHTLRYYDKEGLLPFLDRSNSGIRIFKDTDFEWLSIIECLKSTGMPIKNIREFIGWCMKGDATIKQRYEMFKERKAEVERQMLVLQKALEKIEYKCWYYKTALEAGSTNIHCLALEEKK
jgi:DNA-binding transcriptional MerR regulator